MTVTLSDDEARALATLLARAFVVEAREHAARPTGRALALLRRLAQPVASPVGEPAAETISVAEAAERMGCSSAYVRRLASAGRIAAERVGPVWAIRWPATVAAPQPPESRARRIAP
jgi:excisionase family DNA binding protein